MTQMHNPADAGGPAATVWRNSRRPDFGITHVAAHNGSVAVREKVVAERPFSRLIRFEQAREGDLPRLVMVAPLSSNFAYVMRDAILALLPAHDIYLLEWADGRDVPLVNGAFGFDESIGEILCHLRALEPGAHLMGLCQSVVPTLAATALLAQAGYAAEPKSLVLVSGPVDARIHPTKVDELIRRQPLEWLEQYAVSSVGPLWAGAGRRVYAADTQRAGLMAYMARHVATGKEIQRKMVHDDGADPLTHPFLGHFLSLMDVPGEVFLDTMRLVFHEAALPEGRLEWYGVKVEPAAITRTALMTVEGAEDDIAGPGQTEAAHALTPLLPDNMRFHYRQQGVGHFGTFHGLPWRRDIAPLISRFIARHNGPSET